LTGSSDFYKVIPNRKFVFDGSFIDRSSRFL